MALLLFGIDPESDGGDCPGVWVDTDNGDMVVQGWNADAETQTNCRADNACPDTESIVRVPARTAAMIRRASDVAEHAAAR